MEDNTKYSRMYLHSVFMTSWSTRARNSTEEFSRKSDWPKWF